MDEVTKDPRFRDIGKDPRFRKMPKQARKVKIDNRFQGMFKDKSFKLKYTVDKRGRPIQATTNENLRRFYELSSSEEDSEDESKKTNKKKDKKKSEDTKIKKEKKKEDKTKSKANKDKTTIKVVDKVLKEKEPKSKKELKKGRKKDISNFGDGRFNLAQSKFQESSDEDEEEEEEVEENASESASESSDDSSKEKDSSKSESDSDEESSDDSDAGPGIGPDYARGEGLIESSTDEEFEFEDDKFDHNWGEIDKDAPTAEKSTSRLALCNMDWDRIKARDIMMVLNSFTPPGGVIHSVSIYPSEFGLERMKEENAQGPRELREMSQSNNGEDMTENEEGSEYHREKLRQYQLNRLKYYYAVAVCDSPETANAIYEQCDGMEYETSSTKLDLRFIPEDMTFDQEPKSVAKDILDSSTYKPTLFSNSALNQSKVDLTWDETDRDRVALTMRKISKDELEELDVKDYLASSSEEEANYDIEEPDFGNVDDSDEDSKINKYKLLVQSLKDSEDKKEDKDLEMEISWEPGLKETTEKLVKKKKNEDDLTPWEQYLEKKKEKKKKKRDEKKKKDEGNDESDSEAAEDDNDNLVSDDELPEGIDLNDPYFKEEMEKNAKKGKESKDKKGKKKKNKKLTPEEEEAEKQKQAELQLLMMDEDDQKQHFNLKNIQDKEKTQKKKKKRKMKKKADDVQTVTDTFKMDVSDERFKEVYSNPIYNIDPSAPEFKKTQSMDAMIQEKLKRRKAKNETNKSSEAKRIKLDTIQNVDKPSVNEEERPQKKDASLASLVKSVKAKTNMLKQKKSKR